MRLAKRLICMTLLTLCLLVSSALAEEVKMEWENERFLLSLDESTLIFGVTCKESGETLYSACGETEKGMNAQWTSFLQSTVSIEYAEETSNNTTRATLLSAGATWDIERLNDGFSAQIVFNDVGIYLTLEVRLNAEGFTMTVPKGSMGETDANLLCGVYLAPVFGATHRDEEAGYLLIPEAAGAIINFSDGQTSTSVPYVKSIWGTNAGVTEQTAERAEYPYSKEDEKILMPLYGFAYTQRKVAALCVLEEGADNAQILAYAAGIVTPYNFVSAQYIVREKYFKLNSSTRGAMVNEKQLQDRQLATRVYLLEGDKADYSGMAACYREYLIEHDKLSTIQKKYQLMLNFLGAETQKGVLWNSVVSVTTVSQMTDILKTYRDAGISDVIACYQGWGQGGRTMSYGKLPGAIEGALGNDAQLAELASELKENGGELLLASDMLNAYPGASYSHSELARKINKQIITFFTDHTAYPQLYAVSPAYTAEMAKSLINWMGKNTGFAVLGASNELFSYTVSGSDKHLRGEAVTQYGETFALLDDVGTLALDQPFACYLQYADAYLNMPLETTNYTLISNGVPFLPMAIDGLVPYWSEELNLTTDEDYSLLKLLEYGALPTYMLTAEDASVLRDTNSDNLFSSNWEVFLEPIGDMNEKLSAVWAQIGDATLCRHEKLTDKLTRVEYTNGLSIYLNFGNTETVLASGAVVPARGYLTDGGNAQ